MSVIKKKKTGPYTTIEWTGTESREWDWPVRVGIPKNSGTLIQDFKRRYWPKELSDINALGQSKAKKEIVFLSTLQAVDQFLKSTGDNADASVVLVNAGKDFQKFKTSPAASKLAEALRKKANASGVIFFQSDRQILDWYDEFVINLSHNLGIIKAVQQVPGTQALVFNTPKLNEQSQLSQAVKKVIEKLKERPFLPPAKVPVRLADNKITSMKLNALKSYLEKNFDNLNYDHENATANTVKKTKSILNDKSKAFVKKGRSASVKKKPMSPAGMKRAASGRNPQTGFRITGLKRSAKKSAASSIAESSGKNPKKSITVTRTKPVGAKKADLVKEKKKQADKKSSAPRYLHAGYRKGEKNTIEKEYLIPETMYRLEIKVGENDSALLAATNEIETGELFEDIEVKEVILDLEVRISTMPRPIFKKLTLPREGDSDLLKIKVNSGKAGSTIETEILVSHCNRILQIAKLKMDVRKAGSTTFTKPVFKVEAVIRKQFDNLENRQAFNAMMAFPEKPDSDKPVAGMAGNKPLPFRYTPPMKELVLKIKKSLEMIALTSGKAKLTDESNVGLLRILANQGYKLYNNFLLKMKLDGPLQLINNTGDYLPLDFAYTLGAPDAQSTLCEHAIEALKAGKCHGCIKTRDDEQKKICPFGFWALSQVVERHQYKSTAGSAESDYVLQPDPGSQRKPLLLLKQALHGSSNKVNEAKKNLTKTVCDSIGKHCGKITVAKNWKSWKAAIPSNPDSLILIVHTEENPATMVDALEIGKDLLDQTQLDGRYIPSAKNGKGPFVVLIGCETSNTDGYMFDTVGQLFSNGAAIVVSNFTKILGDQAADIVMQLVALLKQHAGKETRFGDIMLKLRQQLVAEGSLMGLSILSHGDTDWKIKT